MFANQNNQARALMRRRILSSVRWSASESPSTVKAYCEAEGRDYATIEKTSMYRFDASAGERAIEATIDGLHWLGHMGIEMVYFGVADVYRLKPLEIIAERIMPRVA